MASRWYATAAAGGSRFGGHRTTTPGRVRDIGEGAARVAADGHTAFPGAFGENLTLEGLDWAALRAGDRLAIGDGGLEIELVKNASPCTTLQHYFRDGRFARISHKVHPEEARWYARVLGEGSVAPGDRVAVTPAATEP